MLERILDLPANVRMGLFALVAIAVAVLGFMTMTPNDNPAPKDAPSATSSSPAGDGSTVVVPDTVEGAPEEDQFVGDPTDGVELDLQMPVEAVDLKVAAGRAVRFAEVYLSYRYDQNAEKKKSELASLMAADNAVDMSKIFPTGATAEKMRADEIVVDVQATEVAASMVSANMLSLNITATTKTSTVSAGATESENTFAVTMMYEPTGGGWRVSEFLADDSPFLDELPAG
jgi:hypothetical protein